MPDPIKRHWALTFSSEMHRLSLFLSKPCALPYPPTLTCGWEERSFSLSSFCVFIYFFCSDGCPVRVDKAVIICQETVLSGLQL